MDPSHKNVVRGREIPIVPASWVVKWSCGRDVPDLRESGEGVRPAREGRLLGRRIFLAKYDRTSTGVGDSTVARAPMKETASDVGVQYSGEGRAAVEAKTGLREACG